MKKSELRQLIKEIVSAILEDPDGINWSDPATGKEHETHYMDVDTVDSVDIFCHYQGKPMFFAYRPDERRIYCNDLELEKRIGEGVYQEKLNPVFQGNYAAHADLKVVLAKALNDTGFPVYYTNDKRIIHSRVFKKEDQFVFSCWEKLSVMKKSKSLIDEFMKDLGYTTENLLFEPGNLPNKYLTYQEIFGGIAPPASRDDDAILKWKEMLHLNPGLKKAVLKAPENKLQKAADKMNIPLAQLKHLAGTFHETLNESTEADRFYWMDPNGKMHPVPRFGHDFWATDFLSRLNKYPRDNDVYGAMAHLKWYRVVFTEYMGKKFITYEFPEGRPPSPRQVKAIKDLGIELGADEIEGRHF